jgi:hypothetical protein
MTEAIWAILGLLIGWKAATSTGGHPAAVPSAASTAVKNTVHQAVTQASDTVLSVIWSVAWHLVITGLVITGLAAGGRWLLRRARGNIFGH